MSLFRAFEFTMLMNPWALILVVPVIMLLLAEAVAHSPGVVRISTGETMARLVGAKGFLTRRIPAILRALALCLLIIAFARPMSGVTRAQDRADVVDIMLCVDVSGSMKALDFRDPQGEFRDRLYITKAAVRDFIDSRKTKDTDRFGLDRLGLVLYAGFAWTQCPLTLDYGVLEHELALAHIDESDARKQGTAIGSALGLAVSRLRNSEAESKVIILLTDGQNNRGELHPLTAAQIAKDYDIRVYTIGAGAGGVTRIPVRTLFGGQRYRQIESPIDEEMLRTIAEATTGRYYRATDSESLEEAYKEINELETTEIDIGDFYEYEEGFVPYCLAGAFVMALSMFTRRRWFDPIP